ncbi:MAG: COQ9 family protein [Alphaproteobacteria bacterium]|nr:COQ9 family protein [Alphaproteobacteria bacterium]
MSATVRPPSETFREQILEALPPHAARLGWSRAALEAAAADAQLGPGEVDLAFPRGAIDAIDAFADRADKAMEAAIAAMDLPAMRVRDRVAAAVEARLAAQVPHKAACRTMTRALALRPQEAARLVGRTADRLWRALGDPSTDENFYSKRLILSGVLGSTYARWMADEDATLADVRPFIAARIENVMQFEKLKARAKPLNGAGEALAAFAARMRYGG